MARLIEQYHTCQLTKQHKQIQAYTYASTCTRSSLAGRGYGFRA